MYIRELLLTGILLSLTVFTLALPANSGYLKETSGSPIPGAAEKLHHTSANAISNTDVFFSTRNVHPGTNSGGRKDDGYYQNRILISFLYKEI